MLVTGFIGQVESVNGIEANAISLTWAIVTGDNEWNLHQGISSGETHTGLRSGFNSRVILNDPIEIIFHHSDVNNWPMLVCELWDKSFEGVKGFIGCGCIWMPSSPGQHKITVQLWKPELGTDSLREAFLPTYHDLDSIRSLVLDPAAKAQLQCSNSGLVNLEINVLCSNYDQEDIFS
jgi:B9 domain-containing protein 2